MNIAWRAAVASLALAVLAAAPASGDVVINEVEANGSPSDWVELYNTGGVGVSIGGWSVDDENDGSAVTIAPGTTIAPSGFHVVDILGLSNGGDAARLFDDGAALLDSHAWTSE